MWSIGFAVGCIPVIVTLKRGERSRLADYASETL